MDEVGDRLCKEMEQVIIEIHRNLVSAKQDPRNEIRQGAHRIVEMLAAIEMHLLMARTGATEVNLEKARDLIVRIFVTSWIAARTTSSLTLDRPFSAKMIASNYRLRGRGSLSCDASKMRSGANSTA